MKILIVSTVGMDRNGITTVIMNYYRLCKKDVQFDIVVNNYISEELKVEFEEAGSSVYVYQRKHVLNYIKNLNSLLREKKYDAIHVHGNSSTMSLELILAKMNNVLIRIAHCHNSECTHKIINKILKPLLNRTKTQALACSKLAGEWLFGNDFFVLPNGIDVGKFSFDLEKRKATRKKLKLDSFFVVGHVGLFNEQKNHRKLFGVFLETKKLVPNAKLLCVCGNSCVPKAMYELIAEYGIKKDVIVLNNRDDVSDILMAMDFFVFPSKWEGLGLACVEAEATGLKCIVSDKVPRDVDITDGVKHVPLNQTDMEWAKCIVTMGKNTDRKSYNDEVEKSIYNITRNKFKLLKVYSEANIR